MKIASFIFAFLLIGCKPDLTNGEDLAQSIVDEAIAIHGGDLYNQIEAEFDFRKYHYKIKRDNGSFAYERTFQDSLGSIRDVFTNDKTERYIDGEIQSLSEKQIGSISESMNSQVYFALLPYHLNDDAVIKKYIGEQNVEGEPYHKIEITFKQEGGGVDYEDVYVYWFHKVNKTMDYLAYEFHVNEGGFRFRKAYNVRNVNGILFADYINYKESDKNTPLVKYDSLLEAGKLIELSRIELENIKVKP